MSPPPAAAPSPIPTVFQSQDDLLIAVMKLYLDNSSFTADLTYGKGGFWRNMATSLHPFVRSDLDPNSPSDNHWDVRDLPVPDNTWRSVVLDLPFVHAHGKESVVGKRFGSYSSQAALHRMYAQALKECFRVLEPGGLLLFKCMDCVESGKQVWSHILVHNAAVKVGFITQDLMILARGKPPIVGWNHANQAHARRTHTYCWIFLKPALPKARRRRTI